MPLRSRLLIVLSFLILQACERSDVTSPINDGLSPTTPANLSIFRARDGEIGIEWIKNREIDIHRYNIYRSINNTINFIKIDSTQSDFYIDYYLEYDSTYYYRISAVDIFDYESSLTDPVSAKPENLFPPNTPYMIEINARNWDDILSVNLFWYPVENSDLFGYEIYRDTISDFSPNTLNYLQITHINEYCDTNNLQILKRYYYKILSVDKGMLKSYTSATVSDIILNKPILHFPQDKSIVDPFDTFLIKTASLPAYYKITIQTNELTGIVQTIDFHSELTDSIISITLDPSRLSYYRKYFCRIYTFTESQLDPNSISDLYSFIIKPY